MVIKKRGLFACAFIFLSYEVTESLHFLFADGGVGSVFFILQLIPREADEVGCGIDAILGKVCMGHE